MAEKVHTHGLLQLVYQLLVLLLSELAAAAITAGQYVEALVAHLHGLTEFQLHLDRVIQLKQAAADVGVSRVAAVAVFRA